MYTDIHELALSAGLPPLVVRTALLVADIEGVERVCAFIESCRREEEQRAAQRVQVETVSARVHIMETTGVDHEAA